MYSHLEVVQEDRLDYFLQLDRLPHLKLIILHVPIGMTKKVTNKNCHKSR